MLDATIMLGGQVFACSRGSELHGPLVGPGRTISLAGVGPKRPWLRIVGQAQFFYPRTLL